MKRTYHGSCHCGAIRYEADIDLSQGTGKCNCSFCTKARSWAVIVKPEDFRLLSGEDALADYQFGARSTHHFFCRHCGMRPYGQARAGSTEFYTVNLACLDDADPTELARAPVQYVDGRNDDWESAPSEVRHL